jgi:glycosyltransferase involved in cell wall biosynthesis
MRCPTLSELPPPPPGKTGWPWTEESQQLPDCLPDGSEYPRISIVTPNYNYGRFIEETIRSVLLQGYPNLEYIIMDGGSTDDSVEIIKKYEPWLSYWVSEKDKGQSDAINKGFDKAKGEIFYWINSDDILCFSSLKEVSIFFSSHPESNFLSGSGCFFEGEHKNIYKINPSDYSFEDLLEFYNDKYLPQPSVFFSRKIWLMSGGLNILLSYAMDLDLWLRFSKIEQLSSLNNIFSELRIHINSKTVKQNACLIKEIRMVLLQNCENMNSFSKFRHFIKANNLYSKSLLRLSKFELTSGKKIDAFKAAVQAIMYSPWLILNPLSLKIFF